MKFFFLIVLFPLLLSAQTPSVEEKVEATLSKMSLEQKIGQLFVVGFPQTNFDSHLQDHINHYHFGSLIFFKRNIESDAGLKKFLVQLKSYYSDHEVAPPFLAVDQEGGYVSRLKTLPPLPHAFLLGESKSPELARLYGEALGKYLAEVGFNMNLAPVLDLSSIRSRSFIWLRAFDKDPNLVAALGRAWSEALLQQGILPVAKHFPGMGDVKEDPHQKPVVKNLSYKSLLESDLKPFSEFANLGYTSGLMLSHLIYPAIDSEGVPASFSKKINHEFIRDQLHYQGLVITDDLQMKGAASAAHMTAAEASFKALTSGADIIMLSWSVSDQKKSWANVFSKIKDGTWPEKELDEKVRRILHAKFAMAQTQTTARGVAASTSNNSFASLERKLILSILENTSFAGSNTKKHFCLFDSKEPKAHTVVLNQNLGDLSVSSRPEKSNPNCTWSFLAIRNRQEVESAATELKKLSGPTVLLNFGSPLWMKYFADSTQRVNLTHLSGSELGLTVATALVETNGLSAEPQSVRAAPLHVPIPVEPSQNLLPLVVRQQQPSASQSDSAVLR